jgi:hypothetical protein
MATAETVLASRRPVERARDPRRVAHGVSVGLVVLFLFLSHCVNAMYAGLERPAPGVWPALSSMFTQMSILAWFWSYSKYHRIAWVLDMALFVLAAWVIIVPYYVIRHEGRRGLARIGLFCLTYFSAWATGLAVRVWVRVLTG